MARIPVTEAIKKRWPTAKEYEVTTDPEKKFGHIIIWDKDGNEIIRCVLEGN